MAKLPDETVLSGPSVGASGRPLATYDTTGYARGAAALAGGAAAMAGGVSDLGKGITSLGDDVAAIAIKERRDDNSLELARAKSDFLTKKVQLDGSLVNDTDHQTLAGRYSAKIDEIQQGSAALITNPRTRELFTLSTADDVARGTVHADATANKLWKDATLADSNTRLEETRQAALKSTDPIERAKLIQTGNDLISSLADKNIVTKADAVATRQQWTTKYAAGAISMLPPEDRIKALGGFEHSLVTRESSGNPSLVNQFGYAGLYQFGAPRLADMGVYKPGPGEDMKNWSSSSKDTAGKWTGTFDIPGHTEIRTLGDFLKSPDAQRAAFQLHSGKMDQEIVSTGLDKYIGQTVGGVNITREGLHAMIHLGGVGGAKNALEGKGNATDANGTSVLDYARLGNQSDLTRMASMLPADTRVRMFHEAQSEVDRTVAKNAAAQSETLERKIIDAGAGVGTLPNRADIQNDPGLDEPRRNTLLRQYDSAAGDVAGLQRFMTKFRDPNAGAFNPYDTEERKYADKTFAALGGDAAALQSVVARTGMVPQSAAAQMRGSLVSNDPKRVAAALTLSSNLISANPNAFVGIDGRKDFENNAVAFRHYVDDLGMTADVAAKKIIDQQGPEYEVKKARIKSEDIDSRIKKDLSVDDLAGAFDPSFLGLARNPVIGFDPRQRSEMYSQYAEGVKEHYLDTADWSLAKKLSAAELNKTWGVSSVNGKATVMQYPPERAPAYAGIENVSARVAAQAQDEIAKGNDPNYRGRDYKAKHSFEDVPGGVMQSEFGSVPITAKGETTPKADLAAEQAAKDLVPRDKIMLAPIPGVTAQAYKAGQPVPYMLMWSDKDGVIHTLNPGKAFVADPAAMKEAQWSEKTASFVEGRAAAAPLYNRREAWQANRRTTREAAVAAIAAREGPPATLDVAGVP